MAEPNRATTVRLPRDLADRLALVAEIDDDQLTSIFTRLAERHIAERSDDPDFQMKLRYRIATLAPTPPAALAPAAPASGVPACCVEFARTGLAHTEACCFVDDGAGS